MQLWFFPRVRILHTAHEMEGQIYVPEMNFLMGVGSIRLVLIFRESSRLAASFGLAVADTMAITSIISCIVVRKSWGWSQGKALAILLRSTVLIAMVIWNRGRTLVARRSPDRVGSWDLVLARVRARVAAQVPGTAVSGSEEGCERGRHSVRRRRSHPLPGPRGLPRFRKRRNGKADRVAVLRSAIELHGSGPVRCK